MTHIKTPEQKAGRVDELDGLRGLLSLWVVLAHIFCWAGFSEFTVPRPFRRFWAEFIGAGAAVETFMILSGFAITFLLYNRRQSYGQFMRGRFFRIYPVYLVCLVLGITVAIFFTPFVLRTAQWRETIYFTWNRAFSSSEISAMGLHTFWHLTLLTGLIPRSLLSDATGTLLAPAWSISLEWQYYLVAPFLQRFVRTGVGLLLLAMLAWLGLRFGHIWANPRVAFLPALLPLFLIGIGSYHLYELFAKSSCRRSSVFAIPVAALIAVCILTKWHTAALTLWALGFGCIFIQGDDLLSRALTTLRSFLLHRWIQRLGHISYPVYLVHWPLIIVFLATLFYYRPGISSAQALLPLLIFGVPLILFIASILHAFVERPFMTLGKRLNSRIPMLPKRPNPELE